MRHVLKIAATVLYLLTCLALLLGFFMTAGHFSPASRFFWAYLALPPLVLLLYLAALVLLWWKQDRAAPAVVAAEVFFLVLAVTAASCFFITFRWLILAALLRALVAGLSINYLWGRLQRDRLLALIAAGVGLGLGLAWPLLLEPQDSCAEPAIAKAPFLEPVWSHSGPAADLPTPRADFDLGQRGQLTVAGNAGAPPVVQLTFGGTTFNLSPLLTVPQASLDGAWTTPLNSVGLALALPTRTVTWDSGSHRYVLFHYDQVSHIASRLVRIDAQKRANESTMCGDLYLNVDAQAGAIDLVALTGLRHPLWVHDTRFFSLDVRPAPGQKILLPLGRELLPWDWAHGARQFLNLQDSQAVLYQTGPEMTRPLTELARATGFAGYLVIESADGKLAALIYFPDWNTQALRLVSPAAGEPVQANALTFEPQAGPTGETDSSAKPGREAGLLIVASVADTTVGRGRSFFGLRESPVVGLSDGTFLNRLAIRIVPAKSDYAKLIKDIPLWQPPPNPKY
jgi:hypothetical protein